MSNIAVLPEKNHQVWNEPQPLTDKLDPKPYPLDALPEKIKSAVVEVQSFVQAPIAMVASSAMSSISLASQSYIDVKRANQLKGPVSLYMLTIADPNERKSTVDRLFNKPIKEYENKQNELKQSDITNYRADFDFWESKLSGLKDKVRHESKKGNSTELIQVNIRTLHTQEPRYPKIPRLIYEDSTSEKLTYNLSNVWPSAGILSSEGGSVFGSHSMKSDNLVSSLAMLNKLWSNEDIITDRKTSDSFAVRGARLTIGLQIQESPFTTFIDKAGPIARGSGFLARFLFSYPESTQGSRRYVEPPERTPKLDAYYNRVSEILKAEPNINDQGELITNTMYLSKEAKECWIDFYNDIELELGFGGSLQNVRDVSGKIAENVARIAALFHFFERGSHGSISVEYMRNACSIGGWHLNEAQRFYNELKLPTDISNAVKLEDWLIKMQSKQESGFVGNTIPRRQIQQLVTPIRLRNSTTLTNALNLLNATDRIKEQNENKKKLVSINPMLQV